MELTGKKVESIVGATWKIGVFLEFVNKNTSFGDNILALIQPPDGNIICVDIAHIRFNPPLQADI